MRALAILILAAVAAVAGYLAASVGPENVVARARTALSMQPASAARQPPSSPARAPSVPVETALVEVGRVADEIEALGTLGANEVVVIAPEVAGRLTALGFREGDQVAKDQVLARLDSTIAEQEVRQAEIDLRLASDSFERSRSLVQRGSGTQVSLEQATAQYNAAQVRVDLAKSRLEKTTIPAPIKGVVGLRSVSIGNYVTPGQTLATLTDIDPIKVDFRVPELLLSSMRVGQRVRIRVDALADRAFEGEVYAIDPVVDVNGRAIRLRARVPNPDLALKPGLFARVAIETQSRADALLVAESAIVPEGTEKAVYAVVDGQAKLIRVKLGQRLPGKVEVVEGLERGMRIVTAGQIRLRDGVAVEIASQPQARIGITR